MTVKRVPFRTRSTTSGKEARSLFALMGTFMIQLQTINSS
jgi:hypothetical protein